ncbi:MAG: NYN domain-containing protein [Candidatus Saccharibacteria bacterium]
MSDNLKGEAMDVYRVVRAMIFVDGNNLFHSAPQIGKQKGLADHSIRIEYRKLAFVFAQEVNRLVPDYSVYPVVTHYVASIPANYDPRSEQSVEKQRGFFAWLRALPHYQVTLMEIDFRGHAVRRDEEDGEQFELKESKVDMEVAALMLEHCYHDDYDIAILVAGDADYGPALRRIIEKGKQVALFGIRNSCSQEFVNHDPALTTWPVFWIDDLPEVYYRQRPDNPGDASKSDT